jgi:putative NIF3 family GTP cyclohydrolase 1 type 2
VEWLSPKMQYVRGEEELTAGEGIIGTLKIPMSQNEFMEKVKETFSIKSLRSNAASKQTISRVALCGGSGAFLIPKAVAAGADAFLTGEIGYHRFFGHEQEVLLLEMGHYESEQYTLEILRSVIEKKAPELPVFCTEVKTNPIIYL